MKFVFCKYAMIISMDGELWEIKSPLGSGKQTIQNQFRRAAKQSGNMILDISRSRLLEQNVVSKAKFEFKHANNIQKLIILNKSSIILEIHK
jgi:hypothetical protein